MFATSTSPFPLRVLLAIRATVLLLLFAVIAISGAAGLVKWPLANLFVPFSAMVLLLALGLHRLRLSQPLGRYELAIQLLADLVFLTVLFHLTGGIANPFVMLYLPYVALAAVIVPWQQACVLAGFSVLAYIGLAYWAEPLGLGDPALAAHLHLLGMGVNFVVTVAVLVGFVGRLALGLQRREAELGKARQAFARQQAMADVGRWSAALLHEVGGPASSARILLGDWLASPRQTGLVTIPEDELLAMRSELDRMQTSLRRCLSGLRAEQVDLMAELPQWCAQWQNQFPALRLQLEMPAQHGECTQPETSAGWQVLRTVLDTVMSNSLRAHQSLGLAAEHPVILQVLQPKSGMLNIVVGNACAALPEGLLVQLGKQPVQGQGEGVGLMLANELVEARGGSFQVDCRPKGRFHWFETRLTWISGS